MKKFKLTPSIFIWLFGFCVLVSCSNDNDDVNIQTENDLQSASWQITKFIDSDVDETQNFNGYNFNFAGNGALTASNGTNTYNGTWRIEDNNSEDYSQEDLSLIINFNLTNEFEELNEDWDFLSQSSSKMELIHISGGNGGTDYLTFEH